MKIYIKIIVGLLVFFNGCHTSKYNSPQIIRIKGSDTMLALNRLWASEYMMQHPGVSIYADGGGTATGAKALAKGEVQICAASRPLQPEETQQIAQNFYVIGFSILVAKDALSVYLHPANSVNNLTQEQLKGIFSGKITNWKQVGGADKDILVIKRNPNSGSFLYFKDHVLGGTDYTEDGITASTTANVLDHVARHENAIGYGGMAFTNNIKHCWINNIAPSEQNVINGSYPITRYLYLYTVDKPQGTIKNLIDWIISPEGQKIVEKAGYFPIWEH